MTSIGRDSRRSGKLRMPSAGPRLRQAANLTQTSRQPNRATNNVVHALVAHQSTPRYPRVGYAQFMDILKVLLSAEMFIYKRVKRGILRVAVRVMRRHLLCYCCRVRDEMDKLWQLVLLGHNYFKLTGLLK